MSDQDDIDDGVSWVYDFVAPIDVASASRGSSVLVEQRAEEHNDANKGTTLFVASTDAEDRAMDVVKQDWRLRNFRANPVILDNHNTLRVVGRSIDEKVPKVGDDAGRLMIRVRWDLDNPDPSIRAVGHQHLSEFRRAGSVGFKHGKRTRRSKLDQSSPYYREPTKVQTSWGGEYELDGYLFESNELLEFSSATIPMNAEALQRSIVAAYADIDPNDIERRAQITTEIGVPRTVADEILEMARNPTQRAALLDLLWPDFLSRCKVDPDLRRIFRVLVDPGEPAPKPKTQPSLASLILAELERQ